MELLISLLVAVLILGLLYYLVSMLPLPAPFALLVRALFIVICILLLVWYFVPWGHGALRC